ncbi:MAG: FliH/SctL family protein [Phycisphaerales bacterium]
MALIRRTELHGMVYDPVPMDMEDVRLRAQQMREEAEAYAKRVVQEAQAERDRLIAGAEEVGHERGYRDGHAEGLEKGEAEGSEQARAERGEELDKLAAGWAEALGAFRSARDDMLDRARDDVLELACAIACKVVRRSVELDPSAVVEQIKAVLEAHARPTSLFVRVHPDDEALARDVLPELMATMTGGDHVELETDDRVPRGSCTALTEGAGLVDARIDTQLDRIVRELLPDRPATRAKATPNARDEDTGEIGDAA